MVEGTGKSCTLRKCQGRRGCLCPKNPRATKERVYFGVDASQPAATATKPLSAAATVKHAPPAKGLTSRRRAGQATPRQKTMGARSNSKGGGKARHGAAVPGPPALATTPATDPAPSARETGKESETAVDLAVAGGDGLPGGQLQQLSVSDATEGGEDALWPVTGVVTLCYNHYRHEFEIAAPPGAVSVASIDDRFSFSYGFKGNYKIHLRGPGPDGPLLSRCQTGDMIEGYGSTDCAAQEGSWPRWGRDCSHLRPHPPPSPSAHLFQPPALHHMLGATVALWCSRLSSHHGGTPMFVATYCRRTAWRSAASTGQRWRWTRRC